MSKKFARAAALVAAATLAAHAPSALAESPRLRPLVIKLSITETLQINGTLPCLATGTIQGQGKGWPLGTVTAESKDCVNPLGLFNPAQPQSASFLFVSQAPGLVLTAQNGDRVFATYSGTVLPQPNGAPHKVSGTFVITGGTGRYAGAVGGGLLTGTEDISQGTSGTGQLEAVGTIVY